MEMQPMPDDAATLDTTVRALLATSGLRLTEEQIAAFIQSYPTLRRQADRLHAIPQLRYEEPAAVYRASFEGA
jgi:hypothetical protein